MRTFGRAGGVALVLLALLAPEAIAKATAGSGYVRQQQPRRSAASTDNAGRMDANNLDMFVTNHGSFAWDLSTSGPGLLYPSGTTKTALFAAGIWVGAQVNDSIRTCIAEYSQEYAPGPMYNGTFQVDQTAFKNYRLEEGNTTNSDYLNWPYQPVPLGQGAPLDTLNNPLLQGNLTLWSAYNDADPGRHTNGSAGRTKPLGLEIQQTTFAFNRGGALGNIIFMKFRLINKGVNQLDSTYISIWADPDLGDASDDLVGCDTTLSLGYCYNETGNDAVYGTAPPAVGFDFFRGPIVQVSPGVYDTLGMTSFNKYINGEDPTSATEAYHLMEGLKKDGSALHVNDNPLQPVTTFQFPGDPVSSTGWLDGGGNDRRMQLSSGPFTMAVGDTQDVVCALIVGQGTDRLSSITDLKQNDAEAQAVFDLNFDIPSPPPNPTVFVHPLDRGIRLIWGNEPVGTHSENLSLGQDFHFEGFRVWQLASNNKQATAKVVATFDVDDSVGPIYTDLHNKLKGGLVERTLVVSGTNSGLRYSLDLSTDAQGAKLINNRDYYFAVTAYSFDVNNTSTYFLGPNPIGTISEVLESGFKIATATPRGSNAVLTVAGKQTAGDHVGHRVSVEQLDPNALSDSLYRVTFAPDESWTVTSAVSGDTLVTGQTNQSGDFDYPIVRGFMPRVISTTKPASIFQHLAAGDSLDLSHGDPDSAGVYVLDNEIGAGIDGFNFADATNHDYEIRILPDTTEFCWEYNFGDPSVQATYKCPFEIWDLGACSYQDPSDDVKVTAMIRDDDGSGSWTWGDRLYIRDFAYASVPWGTLGLLSTDVDPADDDQTLGRFGFEPNDSAYAANNPLPPSGRLKIRGGRLCPQDVFEFRIVPVGGAPGTIVGNDVKKILAVPNPYYAHSAYELTQFDRVMKFTNIPAAKSVTIRIFNIAGDLVRTIRRTASTADEMARAEIKWDLNTDNNLPVASGIYIYRVDVDGVGSKTDRLAVFIERERLDNF
jgi:hypothetical protein